MFLWRCQAAYYNVSLKVFKFSILMPKHWERSKSHSYAHTNPSVNSSHRIIHYCTNRWLLIGVFTVQPLSVDCTSTLLIQQQCFVIVPYFSNTNPWGGGYNFVYTYARLKRVLQRLIFPSQGPKHTWYVPRQDPIFLASKIQSHDCGSSMKCQHWECIWPRSVDFRIWPIPLLLRHYYLKI